MVDAEKKLNSLAEVVRDHKSCLVTSHNNPDPDAIASAILLKQLLSKRFEMRIELCYGGVIGRAENKELIDYTREKFKRYSRAAAAKVDCVALVDAQPGTGNNPVTIEDKPLLVFDHHIIRPETRSLAFYMVRSDVGATVTLIYALLRTAGLEIDSRLATAAVYALQSETAELQKDACAQDIEAHNELLSIANPQALHRIKNARVDIGYFASIHHGIKQAVLYGDVIVVPLGKLAYPDVVAEVAEYFLQYRSVEHSLAFGQYRDELLFSIRSNSRDENLGTLARSVVEGIGSAGGHGTMAGGQVPLARAGAKSRSRTSNEIIKRFLKELKADKRKPARFVELIRKT
jgi:nanoRNase/pAp phosphatase (c-di-AMP/oligoRNAs hydrolase)